MAFPRLLAALFFAQLVSNGSWVVMALAGNTHPTFTQGMTAMMATLPVFMLVQVELGIGIIPIHVLSKLYYNYHYQHVYRFSPVYRLYLRSVAIPKIQSIVLQTLPKVEAQRFMKTREAIDRQIENFSIRKAECSDPKDRVRIETNIAEVRQVAAGTINSIR